MKNNGEISESCNRYPWDIQICFSERTIIFCSNNYYLIEKNKNVIGDTKMSKWFFDIDEYYNYYFKCPERETNNILSLEGGLIKANKAKPGRNELFKLIEISEDNNAIYPSFNSNLSEHIKDLYSSIELY